MNELFLHHGEISLDLDMLKQHFDSHRSDATFTKTSSMLDDSTTYDTMAAKIGFMSFTFTIAKKDNSSRVVSVSYDGFTCDDDAAFISFIENIIGCGSAEAQKEKDEIEESGGFKEKLVAAALTLLSCASLAAVCAIHAINYVH